MRLLALTLVALAVAASASARNELAAACVPTFAGQLETLPGFDSYQLMDCGDGDIIAVSRFRERASAEQSDDLAARFARTELQGFDLTRNEWLGGGVILVSREAEAAP